MDGSVSIYIGNYYEKVFEPIDEFDPVDPPGSVSEMNYISSFPVVGNGESAPFETIPGQSYYYVGANRVATRTEEGEYIWIYGDHLGSTSVTADRDGEELSRRKYTAWGVTRSGTGAQATDYGYTGQMQVDDIYYYNARWYDPAIGRFMQADTLVPSHQGTQGFDRYAYVNNNPMRYTDPTGHWFRDTNLMMHDGGGLSLKGLYNEIYRNLYNEEAPLFYLRPEWSDWTPGGWNSEGGEGRFHEQNNPNGWKPYNLIPGRPSLNLILKDIVVHHIGEFSFGIGLTSDLELMKSLEIATRGSGLYDIAYHYAIGPNGEVFEGRNIGVRGGAC